MFWFEFIFETKFTNFSSNNSGKLYDFISSKLNAEILKQNLSKSLFEIYLKQYLIVS